MDSYLRNIFINSRNTLFLLVCSLGAILGILTSTKVLQSFLLSIILLLIALLNVKRLFFLIPIIIIFWVPLLSYSSFTLTLLDVVVLLIYLYFFINIISRQKCSFQDLPIKKILTLIFLFLVPGFIAATYFNGFSIGISSTLVNLKKWGMYCGFLLLVPSLSVRNWNKSVKIIVSSVLIVIVYTILATNTNPDYTRSTSLFFNPNVFGMVMAIFFNVCMGLFLNQDINRYFKLLLLLGMFFSIVGVISSASRTAAIGLAIMILFWIWSNRRNFKFNISLVIIIVIVSLQVYFNVTNFESFVDRWREVIADGKDASSVAFRLDAWMIGYKMFLNSPVVGYGFGNLAIPSQQFVTKYGLLVNTEINTTDNQYADIILESGIVGFVIFFSGIVFILRYLKRNMDNSTFAKISFANLILFLFAGFSMPSFYSPFTSALLWYLLSVAFIELKHKRGQNN